MVLNQNFAFNSVNSKIHSPFQEVITSGCLDTWQSILPLPALSSTFFLGFPVLRKAPSRKE